MLTEADVRSLVTHWTTRRAPPAEHHLADDFVFSGVVDLHGKADFARALEVQAPWSGVCILGILVGSTKASAFFEGIDPVTNLTHRIAWLLELAGGKVWKITALDTIVSGVGTSGTRRPSDYGD
jgi:hypothetical protein